VGQSSIFGPLRPNKVGVMTRENKLALVIGFGLMLFVGILVSDHFSAQRFEGAQLVRASNEIDSLEAEIRPIEDLPRSIEGVGDQQVNLGDPVVVDGGGASGPGTIVPGQPENTTGMPIETARADEGDGDPVRLYKVQSGDTLWKIAAREYGDGTVSKELEEYNRAALANGGKLTLNQQLRLPSLRKLRPTRIALPESSIAAAEPNQTKPRVDPDRTHTIAKGDTVYRLAQRYGVKPQVIMAANGISDPAALKPGKTIKIPARTNY